MDSGIRPLPGQVEAVVTPRTSTFPWACELLPPVFARCCWFSAPSDRRTSESLQVPGLVHADGAGFNAAKTALATAAKLEHPQADFPVSLMVYVSGTHVGAVLQHFRGSSWAPLFFFSKKMSPAETRYSALDRELFAVYSAIRHFGMMLEGRQFFILTDHKPLCHALGRLSAPWFARQQRYLAYISEFTQDIRDVPGVDKASLSSSSAFMPRPCRCAAFP